MDDLFPPEKSAYPYGPSITAQSLHISEYQSKASTLARMCGLPQTEENYQRYEDMKVDLLTQMQREADVLTGDIGLLDDGEKRERGREALRSLDTLQLRILDPESQGESAYSLDSPLSDVRRHQLERYRSSLRACEWRYHSARVNNHVELTQQRIRHFNSWAGARVRIAPHCAWAQGWQGTSVGRRVNVSRSGSGERGGQTSRRVLRDIDPTGSEQRRRGRSCSQAPPLQVMIPHMGVCTQPRRLLGWPK